MKLYRVKNVAAVTQLLPANGKYIVNNNKYIIMLSYCRLITKQNTGNPASGVQMVSSSVQRGGPLPSSSSSTSSAGPPVSHEAREKIHIKQVYNSDGKTDVGSEFISKRFNNTKYI